MAPEDRSGPPAGNPNHNPPEEPPTADWVSDRDGWGLWQPEPTHPKYPEEWRAGAELASFARLATSEAVAAAARDIDRRWTDKEADLARLRAAVAEGERLNRLFGDRRRLDQVQAELGLALEPVLAQVADALQGATSEPKELIVAYLAREILPADLANFWSAPLRPASPFQVLANAGDRPVMLVLHPGEWAMKGADIGRKAASLQIGMFITEAEGIIRKARQQPAKKPGRAPDAERAFAVARRVAERPHSGARPWAWEILDELSIPYKSREDARAKVRQWKKRAAALAAEGRRPPNTSEGV